MEVRYLLDEQTSPQVAVLLGKQGVDAEAVADSELAGSDDPTVFRKSVEKGSILVTYNIDDMSVVLGDLLKEGLPVQGVVFVDMRTIPTSDPVGLARGLAKLSKLMASGDLQPGGGLFLQR